MPASAVCCAFLAALADAGHARPVGNNGAGARGAALYAGLILAPSLGGIAFAIRRLKRLRRVAA